MSLSRQQLTRMLIVQLKSSPKQAKLLGALAAVLLVVSIRMIFTLGPDTAMALAPLTPIVVDAPSLVLARQRPDVAIIRPPLPELPEDAARNLFEARWLAKAIKPKPPRSHVEPRRPAAVEEAMPELVLELTLTGATNGQQYYAVINGKRVRVGDTVSGLLVKEISPGLVVLSGRRGERVIARMN